MRLKGKKIRASSVNGPTAESGVADPKSITGNEAVSSMDNETVSSMNNEKISQWLIESMGQMMRQNRIRLWMLHLVEHTLEQIDDFTGGKSGTMRSVEIPGVPESLCRKDIVLEEDWEVCCNMFHELYCGKEQASAQCRSWSKKYGDYIWYEYNFSVTEWKDGVPVRAIGTSRNISAQKKSEHFYQVKQHQMEDALNLAERANNAKSEFLATISHEIRTPLNVIIGMTQLAKDGADDHEAVMEYIDQIGLSGRHLLNLVNNVLDMSKIESGEFTLQPQRYAFSELEKNVSSMFSTLCDQKHISFETLVQGERPDMLVDKMRLNQVIFNLLNNAVKYTKEDGEIQFIILNRVRGNEMETKFLIQDNGIGMSKEFQEQMFKPFTQENSVVVAPSQGTGLGLSISKGIVDKMGGELSVSSVMGRGTTFCVRITIPVAECKTETEAAKGGEADFSGKRILVVEDHRLNQLIITRLLKNRGADVIVAGNGKIGVEKFIESEPGGIDAILMDVRMPVMDGLQATKMIRMMKRWDAADVPIIAMTANAYDEDREKSGAVGMNAHLAKPIDTRVLYETIDRYMKPNHSQSEP